VVAAHHRLRTSFEAMRAWHLAFASSPTLIFRAESYGALYGDRDTALGMSRG
jgi:hypothetical protein